jgi:hypothetical protein
MPKIVVHPVNFTQEEWDAIVHPVRTAYKIHVESKPKLRRGAATRGSAYINAQLLYDKFQPGLRGDGTVKLRRTECRAIEAMADQVMQIITERTIPAYEARDADSTTQLEKLRRARDITWPAIKEKVTACL